MYDDWCYQRTEPYQMIIRICVRAPFIWSLPLQQVSWLMAKWLDFVGETPFLGLVLAIIITKIVYPLLSVEAYDNLNNRTRKISLTCVGRNPTLKSRKRQISSRKLHVAFTRCSCVLFSGYHVQPSHDVVYVCVLPHDFLVCAHLIVIGKLSTGELPHRLTS